MYYAIFSQEHIDSALLFEISAPCRRRAGPVLASCPDPASFNRRLTNPPLKEAGSGHETSPVRLRPAMHLYIRHALYFEIYTKLLEVIQLMSIAGYEAYICVFFFVHKTLCAAFIWLPWDARSCLYVFILCEK